MFGYLGVGIVVVERREVDRGVVGKRKTVFRVVHLHGREQHLVRRGEVIGRVGEFGADAGEPLDLLGTFGVDVGAQIFVGVVFRFDEVVVEVSDTPFEVVGDRRVGRILVEPVAVLLGVAYGLLRRDAGPLPFGGIVCLADQVGAVGVAQAGVELAVAVEERAGGEEQRADLESVGCGCRCAAVPADVLLARREHLDGLVEALHDEVDALVERVARLVELGFVCVERNLVVHDDDRTVILQQGPVEIADQIPGFALPLAQVGLRDVGNLLDAVEECIGVADGRIVVVVHTAGRSSGVAHEVVVYGRCALLAVNHALVAEPSGRAFYGHSQVVASAGLSRHPVLDVVGQVSVDGEEIRERFVLTLECVVQCGVVLRNHVEVVARGGKSQCDADNDAGYSVHMIVCLGVRNCIEDRVSRLFAAGTSVRFRCPAPDPTA